MAMWLGRQTNSLTHLHNDISATVEHVYFPFPSLQALEYLKLNFPDESRPNAWPVAPFDGNPFPALQKLHLQSYFENLEIFRTCSLPSVQELILLRQETPLMDSTWQNLFPNLTSLHIGCYSDLSEIFRSILRYILARLTGLFNLNLYFTENTRSTTLNSYIPNSSWNSWDLLTGGFPVSFQESILSREDLFQEIDVQEEPLNGIYQIPSLQNMRGLS